MSEYPDKVEETTALMNGFAATLNEHPMDVQLTVITSLLANWIARQPERRRARLWKQTTEQVRRMAVELGEMYDRNRTETQQ